jgi:hypothetical protein
MGGTNKMMGSIFKYILLANMCMQLSACSYQKQIHNCKNELPTITNKQGAKKMTNMLDEIYAYPEPMNFDVKDVRHVVEKYISRGSTKQQVIDVLKNQYNFEIIEGEIESGDRQVIYAIYKKGMPLFDMPATIIGIDLTFDAKQDILGNVRATYKVNQ